MVRAVIKYIIPILWGLSVMIFIGCAIIAQFNPFSEKGTAIIMWFTFNTALLAGTLSAAKNNKKFRMTLFIASMLYVTYIVVLRFI